MEQCWRWFGPSDPVSLQKIAQAGASGVVTALHHVPTGDVWPIEEIGKRHAQIKAAGLQWSVVESIPVHSDIQLRTGDCEQRIANYCQSLRNLAEFDIGVVCYNFMPVLDWTRTSLDFRLPNGAEALRFDIACCAERAPSKTIRPKCASEPGIGIARSAKSKFGNSRTALLPVFPAAKVRIGARPCKPKSNAFALSAKNRYVAISSNFSGG